MKLSVKKFSKKSLSLLVALIMIISALPFTPPISVEAATTVTLSKDSFGMLTNGDTPRFPNSKFNIVNDQGSNNTSAGLLHYDLSPFADTNISTVTFNVKIDSFLDEPNIDYVNFYYSTTINNASTYLSETGVENKSLGWGNGAGNKAVTNYSSNLGFNANQILYLQKFETSKSNVTGSKDVTSIFKNIILSGAKDLYIIIMHNTAGDANKNDHWSDTIITPANINFTVTYSDYDFSNPTQSKEYIDSRINGFVMPTAQSVTCNGTDLNLSNVLYTSNTYLENSLTEFSLNQKTNDTKMSARLMSPSNRIVYMYTGNKSIVKVPLFFEAQKNSSVLQRYKVNYVCSASSNWTIDNENWIRTTAYNKWDNNSAGTRDGEYKVSSSSTHNAPDFNANNRPEGVDGTTDFKNLVTYNGTLSFSNNYFQISELPKVDMSFDGFCYWYDWGAQYSYQNNITKNTTGLGKALSTISLANTASYSVIDYSGYNALVSGNTMKNKYNDVKRNETKYTEASVSAYYKAVANLVKFKTSNYDLSTDPGVQSCASELATVVSNYNTAERGLARKTVSVNFYDIANGPKGALEVTPGTTINESDLPPLTTPKYNQNNQHYIYYWKNSDDTEFTVPYTVNNNVDISESRKKEDCKFAVKSISGNTSTVSCSVCNGGTYTLDIEGYNNIVSVAREAINDTVKYDSDSRANLQTVLNNNNTVSDCITKEQIDAKISAIQTAITALVPEKYSVTLHYYDSTGTPLYSESGNIKEIVSDIPYGKLQTISVSGKFNENYVVYKWTRDVDGQNKISGLNSDTLDVVVKENANYYVFLKNTTVDTDTTKNAVITLNNKSNKVVDIGYLDKTSGTASVMISDNTITVGGVMLTAPNYSFYTISGFTINGQPVTSGDSITITDKIVIKPVYEPTLDAFIKRAENETFLINGKAENLAVKWNQKVVLNTIDGTEVAWIAGIDRDGNGTIDSTEKNIVGYGSSYSFYANSNVTFYTELTTVNVPKTSIGLFSYNANENKVTLVNNFYAPSGYTVKYAGVVLSTKTDNRDKLIAQTNGRFFGGESDFSGNDSNKNQIRISVTRTATTSFDMHALAYIIVQNPNGTEETIYADNVETIHYPVN